MRDEREERSMQPRSKKQQGKVTQHAQGSHFFSKNNELLRVGLNPTTLYTLDRALYQLSYQAELPRQLCLEYRVSWVRVPPEAAHFF